MARWDQNWNKNHPKSIKNKSKIDPKAMKNWSWRVMEAMLVTKAKLDTRRIVLWSNFWPQVGVQFGVMLGQRTDTKTASKSKRILDRILVRLGPILEAMLGPC